MKTTSRGTFVPDERLRPRDNSGGPMGPRHSGDFGEGGMVTGGEPTNSEPMGGDDEMIVRRRSNKGGY